MAEISKQVSSRTALELERGRIIAQRAQRQRDLTRYEKGGKVKVMVAMNGHENYEPRGQVNLFYVAGVKVAHQNIIDDDYPSEGVMAFIALAVGVTVGTEGIPPVMDDSPDAAAARERRNAYRDKYLGQWRELNEPKVTAAVKDKP